MLKTALKFALVFSLATGVSHADIEATEKAEEQARKSFIDRFFKFTQDKNVMGKAMSLDGKTSAVGQKTRFNGDDGLSFQSDLTYHDFGYTTFEETKDENGKAKRERLDSFVSNHGRESEAGGSSQLERTVFGAYQAAREREKKGEVEDEPEKGVRITSIFKVTTKEVIGPEPAPQTAQSTIPTPGSDPSSSGAPAKADQPEKIAVERRELLGDVREQVAKVGEDSAETIKDSARDEESKGDQNALSNGILLRFAAAQALNAMDTSTAANLAQRRINRAIRPGGALLADSTPQLSESIPDCGNYSQQISALIAKAQTDDQRKRLQEEVQRMTDQCQQLSKTPLDAVGLKFVPNDDGKGETLKSVGLNKEDGLERDMRAQLETLRKGGVDVREIPNNWGYSEADGKAEVTQINPEDNSPEKQQLTAAEQIEAYNRQLEEAQKAFQNEILPQTGGKFDPSSVGKFRIEPGEKSLAEIAQPPAFTLEEYGVEKSPTADRPPAETYEDLLQAAKQE